jgi:hypothetical protein
MADTEMQSAYCGGGGMVVCLNILLENPSKLGFKF